MSKKSCKIQIYKLDESNIIKENDDLTKITYPIMTIKCIDTPTRTEISEDKKT